MRTYVVDNKLGIVLPPRVDSNNASALTEEIQEIFNNKKEEHIFFDASEMKYISSAGLRIVLKFRKEDPELKIIDVCSDVYDIFETTGFTEIIPIEKTYKKMNVDDCKIIGKGAKGTVYRYDSDTVLKVYNDANSINAIKNERELAKKAFVLGIPTAISFGIVKVGDKYGAIYELIDADSFSGIMAKDPSKIEEYSKMFADMLLLIHSTDVDSSLPNAKIKYDIYWCSSLNKVVDEPTFRKVEKLLEKIPSPEKMLHCDYHTNNMMLQNDEPIVIDMDTLSYGHPIYDLGSICFTYHTQPQFDPGAAESFLGLNAEAVDKIWNIFIKRYLKDYSPEIAEMIENKIICFSYLRLINHLVRRSPDPKNDPRIIKVVEEFRKSLDTIDTFAW